MGYGPEEIKKRFLKEEEVIAEEEIQSGVRDMYNVVNKLYSKTTKD